MLTNEILNWIKTATTELNSLENQKGKYIIEQCGRNCAKSHKLGEEARLVRSEAKDKNDINVLFDLYKKKIYNTSRLYKKNGTIFLEYHKCGCPIVNSGDISDPFFCNCTIGYTKERFENLFGKPVKVELLKSILQGDKICKQAITMLEDD
ncbi:MAG: hypothetical protein GY793_02310 [Proteobacteria bacterium]|nr:hypothetical protein [Pseudomonadota bacterium]